LIVFAYGETFDKRVEVVGNVIVEFIKCKFERGLRIISSSTNESVPASVLIKDCEMPVSDPVYPVKIGATATPNRWIKSVVLDGVVASGPGVPYTLNHPSTPGYTGLSGTPDNIAIHHCEDMRLMNCYSIGGGENGYSLNASERIGLTNCSAYGNDGQGLHIGDHKTAMVWSLEIDGFSSSGNFVNQLGTPGSSCGVLIHNTRGAEILNLLSIQNRFAVSHQLREVSKGSLHVEGYAYGVEKPVLATSNVLVSNMLISGVLENGEKE
jgi:hypothetical protein